MFLTEIIDDRIRGALLSTVYVSENVGFLLAYAMGDFFDYFSMPLFGIILTATYTVLLIFLPEAPIFLVQKNKIEVSVEMKFN